MTWGWTQGIDRNWLLFEVCDQCLPLVEMIHLNKQQFYQQILYGKWHTKEKSFIATDFIIYRFKNYIFARRKTQTFENNLICKNCEVI